MGKKSRLKKERKALKELDLPDSLAKKLVSIDGYNSPIYRFFPEKWQAEALCNGEVWISTLETCRQFEDPNQGDAEEAIHTYNSGHIFGGSNDPAFVEMASRSGVHIGEGCSNITISGCTNVQKLPNSFVLCTTTSYKPNELSGTFGNYCVQISNPKEFFKQTSKALNLRTTIKEGAQGKVIYSDRVYTGLQQIPGPIGFVKPIDKYATQEEYRFLWIPMLSDDIQPFLLHCPEVAELCTMVE